MQTYTKYTLTIKPNHEGGTCLNYYLEEIDQNIDFDFNHSIKLYIRCKITFPDLRIIMKAATMMTKRQVIIDYRDALIVEGGVSGDVVYTDKVLETGFDPHKDIRKQFNNLKLAILTDPKFDYDCPIGRWWYKYKKHFDISPKLLHCMKGTDNMFLDRRSLIHHVENNIAIMKGGYIHGVEVGDVFRGLDSKRDLKVIEVSPLYSYVKFDTEVGIYDDYYLTEYNFDEVTKSFKVIDVGNGLQSCVYKYDFGKGLRQYALCEPMKLTPGLIKHFRVNMYWVIKTFNVLSKKCTQNKLNFIRYADNKGLSRRMQKPLFINDTDDEFTFMPKSDSDITVYMSAYYFETTGIFESLTNQQRKCLKRSDEIFSFDFVRELAINKETHGSELIIVVATQTIENKDMNNGFIDLSADEKIKGIIEFNPKVAEVDKKTPTNLSMFVL